METPDLVPLLIYAAAVVATVALLLLASHLLGQRHDEPATAEPFESGVVGIGYARFRVSANFYLIAVAFVIFDMEAAFLIAWAIALQDTGWLGYWGAMAFILILVAALVYEWRLGALDWARTLGRRHGQYRV